MNRRANPNRVFATIAILTLVLFKFQNCAPTNGNSLAANDPTVGLIDGWKKQKVAFLSPTHVIAGLSQPLEIHGLCMSDSASRIYVQILSADSNAQVLESQEVECVMGGFEISSISQVSTTCNDRWRIRAMSTNDPASLAETEVQVDCQL